MELIQNFYHSLQLLEGPALCLEIPSGGGLQTDLYIKFSFAIQTRF